MHLLKLESKIVFASKDKSLWIPTLLKSLHSMTEKQVLVDSGDTDNFISNKLLKRLKVGKLQLKTPRTVWNIDSTHNKAGTIWECVNLLEWWYAPGFPGPYKHNFQYFYDLFRLCAVAFQYPSAQSPRGDSLRAGTDQNVRTSPIYDNSANPPECRVLRRLRAQAMWRQTLWAVSHLP